MPEFFTEGPLSMRRIPFQTKLPAMGLLALAGASLAGCDDSSLSPVTARSLAPVPPKTVAEMETIGSSKEAPVLIRAYKKESELEIWKMKADGRYAYLKTFPMCRWSGQLGPKTREGDRQVPEGFYSITPARMNPNSAYYLSFDVGYPNTYDRALGRSGGSIMVHGVCSSAGCFSMTDAQIAEIYAIARDAFSGGQQAIQMQSYPFHMTAENLAKYRLDPNIAFWKQLKEGADNFEVTKKDVAVGVCDKRYVFNAVPADGSHFDPLAPCPLLKHNDETQAEVMAKIKRDEAKIAELVGQGVRPIHTVYADGGQHPDFAALASTASRPEALTKAPVDVALNEGKSKKSRLAAATKLDRVKSGKPNAAAKLEPSSSPAEPMTVAAAPEAAKPQNASWFDKLWGAKPAEADAASTAPAPAGAVPPAAPSAAAAPQPAPVPLPPKRNEPISSGAAKPRDTTGKPQNSVSVPAPVKPQASLTGTKKNTSTAVAMLRGGYSPAEPAGQARSTQQ